MLSEEGKGSFSDVEKALKWVVQNASTYNIVSVNLSLGDQENHTTPQTLYGIDDELSQLAANRVIVVAASGNDFYEFNSAQGVCYPAADPNAISVGAVFASGSGRQSYENDDGSPSAIAYTSGPDRIAPFSQRDASLTTIFAPGAPITSAGLDGNTATFHGTSQAAAYVSGIAVLAQELAMQHLGRRLTTTEFAQLLRDTGTIVHNGDDEDDNVINTGLDFRRVDVYALAERILTMGNLPGKHVVRLGSDQVIDGADFGNYQGVPVTALGSVDLQHLAALPAASGGVWYAVEAAHDALLTLEGGVSAPGQSLELTLYAQGPATGSTPTELAKSTTVGGKQRIDWAVTAGQTYYFRVKSSGASIDLTIANLVARVGSQTTVFGTAGADPVRVRRRAVACGCRSAVWHTSFPQATAATVTFGGGEGDTAVLRGASGDDTVTLRPGTATFSGAGFVVNVANTADITVYGQGGHDTASLYDSAGNDNFLGAPTYAAMYGDGFYNRAWNFSSVRAEAGDGIDVAKFYDSPGNDQYVGAPTYNALSGAAYHNEAWYFEGSHAYATAGGVDEAKFYDSTGDDQYVATPTYAALFNTEYRDAHMTQGYYNRAKFFEGVHAFATAGGVDVAMFYDSTANDQYVATPTYAALFNPDYKQEYTHGFYNRAKFFEATHAFATAGGVDVAYLYDSTAADTFYADPIHGACSIRPTRNRTPTGSTIGPSTSRPSMPSPRPAATTRPNCTTRPATTPSTPRRPKDLSTIRPIASRTPRVSTIGPSSSRRSPPTARPAASTWPKCTTRTANDTFEADPSGGVLYNASYRQSYTNGFRNRAVAFDEVHVTAHGGDDDRAYLQDSSAEADLLAADQDWARLACAALDYVFQVDGFDFVRATASTSADTKYLLSLDLLLFDLELNGPWQNPPG